MNNKITLALIGAGSRGQYSYAPYVKLHGYEVEFTAVADSDQVRRSKFAKDYDVKEENTFETGESLLSMPRLADAILICTPDNNHFTLAMKAIELGYSVLLEKPISPSASECLQLQEKALEKGCIIMVCHVLRYTKFYKTLKQLLDQKAIGDIVHVTHTENVGYWHYAHSYVRGNWHKTASSSPMILAKCCHDMDILSWLLQSRIKSVASFGGLKYFCEENAPKNSPARCTDGCEQSGACPFYAPALYLDDNCSWPTAAIALSADSSYEARKQALQNGPYGVCVFHTDNDVVDHQTASIVFENNTTLAFSMCAFTDACDRTMKFMGTKGEIRASMDNNVIELTEFGQGVRTGTKQTFKINPGTTGHSGGDDGIMHEFISILKGEIKNTNTIQQSVHSHIAAFATEQARLSGQVVQLKSFEEELIQSGV